MRILFRVQSKVYFFVISQGLFEFTVMPFGMKMALATFQSTMKSNVLQELESFADAYIDDI
jgi:phosphomevalonate kinase